ncbi:MAG: hypothetical protein ACOX5C_06075 [Acutalibacteraceae bacterium]|jgi:hypothetical protein
MRLKKFIVLSLTLLMCFVFPLTSLAAEDSGSGIAGGLFDGIGDAFGGFDFSGIKDIIPGVDGFSDIFDGLGGGLFDGLGGGLFDGIGKLFPGIGGSTPTTTAPTTEEPSETESPTIPQLPTLPPSPTIPSTSGSSNKPPTTKAPTTTENYEPVTEPTTENEESTTQNTYTRPTTNPYNYTDNVDSIDFDNGESGGMSAPFKIGLGAGLLAVSIGGIILIILKFKG